MAPVQQQALEDRAASEQAVEGVFPHGNGSHGELLKAREVKRRWRAVHKEPAIAEAGRAQGRREAENGQRHRSIVPREPEVDLLEISESGGPEPAVGVGDLEAGGEEAARGARVVGEDLGHGGGAVAAAPVDMGNVEVERGGAPYGTPAAGEGCGAQGVVDGEERYDYAEDLTGERADQIDFLQIR